MSNVARKPMINTGMKESERKSVAEGLAKVLADTFTLYLKTHNFHWNVTGNMFGELHRMFEEQYQELFEAFSEPHKGSAPATSCAGDTTCPRTKWCVLRPSRPPQNRGQHYDGHGNPATDGEKDFEPRGEGRDSDVRQTFV